MCSNCTCSIFSIHVNISVCVIKRTRLIQYLCYLMRIIGHCCGRERGRWRRGRTEHGWRWYDSDLRYSDRRQIYEPDNVTMLRRIYTSGFCMHLPHCVAIFNNLTWFAQSRQVIKNCNAMRKTHVETECVNAP